MSIRLRELIRLVRACKTAADERQVIAKECAAIRTAFKDEDNAYRHRNVAKLLFIQMLGYPTHFGQMECLKLIAGNKYAEKRIGYLGLMLLLDEKQEVLTLVTNSLKVDLNSSNQYICGLALCAVGDIASPDIARDLSPEVEKLLKNSNPYIRKKAACAAIRIMRKVPDLVEEYVERVSGLLNDRNHGVLLGGMTMLVDICENHDEYIGHFRRLVPTLVRLLKNLVLSGYAPEHDVAGITDPFLQVKILRLLRMLGKGDAHASDCMNDILAQVATNTETSKNAGNAILYECVLTVMNIESESGLRVLAINILGRFLLNRDNNIRYVALNTLSKVFSSDLQAIQRHRNTIVECLKDPDISIRRRALDLIYSLINESNIRVLVRELLNYLLVADVEFKADLTTKICFVVEKYAPNKRWHVDTVIRVLTIAGTYVDEQTPKSLIALITNSPDLHGYTVQKLYMSIKDDMAQQALVQVAAWCIGEFGDLLIAGQGGTEDEPAVDVSEKDVVYLLEDILKSSGSSLLTREYALTAVMKLSSRFTATLDIIHDLICTFKASIYLELQQRSCEYMNLFGLEQLRPAILERMPIIEDEVRNKSGGDSTPKGEAPAARPASNGDVSVKQPAAKKEKDLLDLDSLMDDPAPAPANGALDLLGGGPAAPAAQPGATGSSGGGMDLLNDLLGGAPAAPAPAAAAQPQQAMLGGGLDALITPAAQPAAVMPAAAPQQMPGAAAPAPAAPGSFPGITAYNKNGIMITFDFAKQPNNPAVTAVRASMMNSSPAVISELNFQVAVPKYITMQIKPPSGKDLPPNNQGKVTQVVQLTNNAHGQNPIKVRVKLDYKTNGTPFTETFAVENFPPGL